MTPPTIRASVFIVNSFLCFGVYFLYCTTVSLQTILIGTPCNDLNETFPVSKNCCEACLGFSPLEYNILVGLPLAVSIVSGILFGFIVDRYGYCLFTFIVANFVVVGAVLKALGARPGLSHDLSYGLMLTGSMIVDNVNTILYITQLYVSVRWFSGQYLSLIVGFSLSMSMSGTVLAFYLTPALESSVGLENTLWYAVPFGATAVIAAVALWIFEKISENGEYGKVETTEPSNFSLSTVKELNSRFWLVSCTIGMSWLVSNTFECNSTAYQIDIFGLHYDTASFSSGVIFITKIIFAPIAGMLASRFGIHGLVAIFGCICNILGLAMLATSTGPSIIILIFIGLGFACVYTVMAAVLADLVAFDKLATANGIMNIMLCVGIGTGDIVVGLIAQSQPDLVQGWLDSAAFLLAVAAAEFAVVIALLVVDATSAKRVMLCREQNFVHLDDDEFIVN